MHFGRERKEGTIRRPTANVHHFKSFGTSGILRHLRDQHAEKWAEYERLDNGQRAVFFGAPNQPSVSSLLNARAAEKGLPNCFSVSAAIVERIIGEVFGCDDDDPEQVPRAVDNIFKPVPPEDDEDYDGEVKEYIVTVHEGMRFNMIVRFLCAGASFRMTNTLIHGVCEETGMAALRGCTRKMVSQVARIVCAHGLQMLRDLLATCWTFSVALDTSNNLGSSYFDIRVRFFCRGEIRNYHLLAAPIQGSHTGENMFQEFEKVFDAIEPHWRAKLLGVSSDGDRAMTGKNVGVVTRIERVCDNALMRVWCGLHRLDLVMQDVYTKGMDANFYPQLVSLISYLRRQQNLISDMKKVCPKVATTRWLSTHSVLKWLNRNCFPVRRYLDAKNPTCKPSFEWWAFVATLEHITEPVNQTFVSLQGLTTTTAEQCAALEGLVESLCLMVNVQRVESDSEERDGYVKSGSYAVALSHCEDLMKERALWIQEELDALEAFNEQAANALRENVAKRIGSLVVAVCNGINAFVPSESNRANRPPVTPHELASASCNVASFRFYVDGQRGRLERFFSEEYVHELGREFVCFKTALQMEEPLRVAVAACTGKESFADAWKPCMGRWPLLLTFCGGLASIFPNTAVVESDFSVLGWEKDEFRKNLTDLSLEGIFYSKQYAGLRKLTMECADV